MHKTALIDNDVDYRFHRLFKPGRGLIKDMKTERALADNIYQVLAILSDSAQREIYSSFFQLDSKIQSRFKAAIIVNSFIECSFIV